MTKEELRKEFDELHPSNWDQDRDKKFDWFWSKLEEKNNDINFIGKRIMLYDIKLKAADEVINQLTVFSSISPSEYFVTPTASILDNKQMVKALEHYKSLKP